MRVFIHATEGIYQGLHGVEYLGVHEVADSNEAYELGYDYAEELVERYGLEEEYEESTFEPEFFCECYVIDRGWDDISLGQLDEMCNMHEPEFFIEHYCYPQPLL